MGFDDLIDDVEEEKKQDEVEELKESLGIEDKEDMEQLEGRLQNLMSMQITLDKRMEEMEDEVRILRKALGAVLKEIDSRNEESAEEDDSDTVF